MISVADVVAARGRIGASIVVTPCSFSATFSSLTGNRVHLKLENQQRTGSFKERGALNKILLLSDEEKKRGIICASAGNHAQGVAYHAREQGIAATIVMPQAAPLFKVTRTREFGAEVILHGESYDDAFDEAWRRCQEHGMTFIHAFDDEAVMAGQGTIGLELLEQNPELDAVIIPIGGGGLAAGIATAIKERKAGVEIIGVETERVPSMMRALEAHQPVTVPPALTLADGIAVRRAGVKTLPVIERYIDRIVTVDEEEIAKAILLLLEREKTVAEGAGAAGLAALVQGKTGLTDKNVVVLVGGGNIDVNLLSRIIERGLVKDGRLVRLRVRIADHPGALHRLTGHIAGSRANILEVFHNRAFSRVDLGETAVDCTLETRGSPHIVELMALLGKQGYELERLF